VAQETCLVNRLNGGETRPRGIQHQLERTVVVDFRVVYENAVAGLSFDLGRLLYLPSIRPTAAALLPAHECASRRGEQEYRDKGTASP
jgi:hypothetical protein